MKRHLIFGLMFVAALVCSAQGTFRPGEIWPDNNGQHINAHGGGVMYHKGTYYWYGEHKADTTSSAYVGVTCYSSKNLTDWTNRGVALAVTDEKGSDIEKGCILERPKVIYCKKTKKFVMWFHLELKGKGYSAARYGVAIGDKPCGPFKFVKSGRVLPKTYPQGFDASLANSLKASLDKKMDWWTPEWRKEIERGMFLQRDYDGGQMARDQTVYVDDDGKAYHIYSSEDNLTLQIAELNDDYTEHTGRYWRMAPGGQNEAPALFKKDGKYWMITSGCTGWAPNKARMFYADKITGPWTQVETPCRGEKADITYGGQSTYILKVEGKGEPRFIFMADIWRPKHPSDARYIWLPIEFDNDVPFLRWQNEWTLK